MAFPKANPRKGTETTFLASLPSGNRLSQKLIPARGLKLKDIEKTGKDLQRLSQKLIPARGLKQEKLPGWQTAKSLLSQKLIPARGLKPANNTLENRTEAGFPKS